MQELLPPGVVIISYISRALFLCMIFFIILAGNHSYFLTDWCELMQLTPII